MKFDWEWQGIKKVITCTGSAGTVFGVDNYLLKQINAYLMMKFLFNNINSVDCIMEMYPIFYYRQVRFIGHHRATDE